MKKVMRCKCIAMHCLTSRVRNIPDTTNIWPRNSIFLTHLSGHDWNNSFEIIFAYEIVLLENSSEIKHLSEFQGVTGNWMYLWFFMDQFSNKRVYLTTPKLKFRKKLDELPLKRSGSWPEKWNFQKNFWMTFPWFDNKG